ncbi:MAG: tandem-95 repeat protein [Planctomycetes bacterium]|nr:tandem-95 repeat protein [Planctomycetota bacterium]
MRRKLTRARKRKQRKPLSNTLSKRRAFVEQLEPRLLLTADAPGDDLSTAQALSLTPDVTTELQENIGDGLYGYADVDLFQVSLTAGETLEVDVDAEYLDDGTWYGLLDSHLRVFDSSGVELVSNGDGQSSNDYYTYYDSYLSYSASTSGDYYVGVSSSGNEFYDPNSAGTGYGYSDGDYVLQLLVTSSGGGGNQAPNVENDSYAIEQDTTLTIAAAGVLTNDSDGEGDSLTASLQSSPTNGVLNYFNADGAFQYVPNSGFVGNDSFAYLANDGTDDSTTATVTVTVNAVSNDPGDDLGSAQVLSLTAGVTNELQHSVGDGIYGDADVDLFKVSLDSGQSLDIDIDAEYLDDGTWYGSLDSHLRLFNSAGVEIASNADALSPNDDSSVTYDSFISFNVATTGHYYIGVSSEGNEGYDPNVAGIGNGNTSDDYVLQVLVTGGGNIAPVGVNDGYSTNKDTTLTIQPTGVLANDTDADGDGLTGSLQAAPSSGTLNYFNADGSFEYVPTGGFVGSDSFTYKANDGTDDSNLVTVNISVQDPNSDPIVENSIPNQTLNEDADPVVIDISNVFSDSDVGDQLTLSLSGNTNGMLLLPALSGTDLTIELEADQHGSAQVSLKAKDLAGAFVETNILFTVLSVNDAPLAIDRLFRVGHDDVLSAASDTGLLSTATDVDGDALTAILVSAPQNGSVSLADDGSFSYVPASGFIGTDEFVYQVDDGAVQSSNSTVRIEVVDLAPVAVPDGYEVRHDALLATDVTAGTLQNDFDPDGDAISGVLVEPPLFGILDFHSDGSFLYTPDAGFVGRDNFTYFATDGDLDSPEVTVAIDVTNRVPIALDDRFSVLHDTELNITLESGLLDNDIVDATESQTVTLIDDVQNGALVLNGDGSFAYTPTSGFVGEDLFTYQVSDGLSTSDVASVRIAVDNLPAKSEIDVYRLLHGTLLDVSSEDGVLANDTVEPSDAPLLTLVKDTSHGSLTLSNDGSFEYSPDETFTGIDEFTYTVSDGFTTSQVTPVILVVENQQPVGQSDNYFVAQNESLVVSQASGVTVNDFDDEGDSTTVLLVDDVREGNLVLASDGSFTYAPNTGFVGIDEFSYRLTDGIIESTRVVVSIDVTDLPIRGTNDFFEVNHDQTLAIPSSSGILNGDWSAGAATLVANLVSTTQHGELTLSDDGAFTYVPGTGFTGADEFTYRASDGTNESSDVTVEILVVNQVPTAVANSYRLQRGDTLNVDDENGVLHDDIDTAEDVLVASLITSPANGTLSFLSDGSFTYSADSGFEGNDTFTYRVSDGVSDSENASVTIEVFNRTPTANPDSYRLHHGKPLAISSSAGVLGNDEDDVTSTLSAALVSGVSSGTLEFQVDGSFNYVPSPGFVGIDSFQYRVSDGFADSLPIEVSLTVDNNAPQATSDFSSTLHDTSISLVGSNNILANDFDLNGDSLEVLISNQPEYGQLETDLHGQLRYIPLAGFVGRDTFTYQASDGAATSDDVLVTLQVWNDAPKATADTYEVLHDSLLQATADIGLLQNDWDANQDTLTIAVATYPDHGSLQVSASGTFDYVPASGFVGQDAFSYFVSDGAIQSESVTVAINVTNAEPQVHADHYWLSHDASLVVDTEHGVLANDWDQDGDTLTLQISSQVEHGSLSLNQDGGFTYTPDQGFAGTDQFFYTVSDGAFSSEPVLVSLEIRNAAPQVGDDFYRGHHGTDLTIAAQEGILKNDWDADGDSVSVVLLTQPSNGTLSLAQDGSLQYSPNSGFVGADSFTYELSDGVATTAPAQVTLRIENHRPTAIGDTYSTGKDELLTVAVDQGLLGNDYDLDQDSLVLTVQQNPSQGSLGVNADGSFTYTPSAGFTGSDSFVYRIHDGAANAEATATIIVREHRSDVATSSYVGILDQPVSISAEDGLLRTVIASERNLVTLTLEQAPQDGDVALNSDGSFVFTSNSGFLGSDSFVVRTALGATTLETITAVVEIFPPAPSASSVYEPPIAVPDGPHKYRVHNSQSLVVDVAGGVLANDFVDDGLELVAAMQTSPVHGTVTLSADGSFLYVPSPDFIGEDSFTYVATDQEIGGGTSGAGGTTTAPATVAITVYNAPPEAIQNTYHVHHDQTLNVGADFGVLANDLDEPWSVLSATLIADVEYGTLSFSSDGSFIYIPNAGFVGTDTFEYQADDGSLDSEIVAVTLDVWNTLPTANDNSYRVHRDTSLIVSPQLGILANDWDDDHDALTISIQDNVEHGSLSMNADGSFSYSPDANYIGPENFSYQITDGPATSTAKVEIDVHNRKPVATANNHRVHHDTDVTGNFLNDDWDGDGDAIHVVAATSPTSGALTWNADGDFTYTPNNGFVGTDSFLYSISDGAETSDQVSVTIDVWNNAPWSNEDYYSTRRGVALDIAALDGVLSNDRDWDDDGLTVAVVATTAHGTLTLESSGEFSYTPLPEFSGTDSFTYEVSDGITESQPTKVTLDVFNNAPWAIDDNFTFAHGLNSVTGDLLANDWEPDGESMTIALSGASPSGNLALNPDGTFTYSPPSTSDGSHFTGIVTFKYVAKDGADDSEPGLVTLDFSNSHPKGIEDYYRTMHDNTLAVSAPGVLGNDYDADGDSLTAVLTVGSGPSSGALANGLEADGSFTYIPDVGFHGTDSFQYRTFDGADYSDPVVVTIDVTNYNPIGVMDTYHGSLASSYLGGIAGNVLANDFDDDGDLIYAELADEASYGAVNLLEDGSFVYTRSIATISPTAAFFGYDTFTYRVTDRVGESEDTLVLIVLGADSQAAYDDYYRTFKGQMLQVPAKGVLDNDWSASATVPLTVTLSSSPTNGTVNFQADGSFDYTPNSGFTGMDSFDYKLGSNGDEATVEIVVVELAPADDSYTIVHDRRLNGDVQSNDQYSQGESAHVQLDTDVSNGALTLYSDGEFYYVPNSGFVGADSFTYRLNNGIDDVSSPATVTIEVTNVGPSATSKTYTVAADQPLVTTTGSGVLGSANDPDGDRLIAYPDPALAGTVPAGGSVVHGSLEWNEDGSFVFIPVAGFHGTTSFDFFVTDDVSPPIQQTITINVLNNSAPSGSARAFYTYRDQLLTVGRGQGVLRDAIDEHPGSLTAVHVGGPLNAASFNLNSDGSFIYVPVSGYASPEGTPDEFTFFIRDELGNQSAIYTATITVDHFLDFGASKIQPGVALPCSGDLLVPTHDYDGDPLTVSRDSSDGVGSVVVNSDGSYVFTPHPIASYEQGSFGVAISDGFETEHLSVSVSCHTDVDADTLLEAGETWHGPSSLIVQNDGPGTVQVAGWTTDSATLAAVSGSSFNVYVTGGSVTWTGSVSGQLTLSATYDISDISISGDVFISSGTGMVGDITARNVRVLAYSIGDVYATGDVIDLIVGVSSGFDAMGRTRPWDAASKLGTIGNVTAVGSIGYVSGTRIKDVEAGVAVDTIEAYELGSVTAGTNIGTIKLTTALINDISAGGHIGCVSDAGLANCSLAVQSYAGNPEGIHIAGPIAAKISAGKSIERILGLELSSAGTISAGQDIHDVEMLEDIAGNITAGRDIYRVAAGASITSSGRVEAVGGIRDVTTGFDSLGTILALDQNSSLGLELRANRMVSGTVEVGKIVSIAAGLELTADIDSATSIGEIESRVIDAEIVSGTTIGIVAATRTISGKIDAGTDINQILADRDINGEIESGGNINEVRSRLDIVASIDALYGHVELVDAGVDLKGSINAHSMGTIDAGRDIYSAAWISVNVGGINLINAGRDILAASIGTNGDIASVVAGGTIASSIAADGSVLLDVTAGRNISGSITVGGSIKNIRAGKPSSGSAASSGSITSATISAGTWITLIEALQSQLDLAGGDISVGTIQAGTYITTIAADGTIEANIEAQSYIKTIDAGRKNVGDIIGDIKAVTESIDIVHATHGSIEGSVVAGADIDSIYADFNIIADIEVDTTLPSVTGREGEINGSIDVGTDLTIVHAGGTIDATIEAGGTIKEVFAGLAYGGSILQSINAGVEIENVTAHEMWDAGYALPVWETEDYSTGLDLNVGDSTPSSTKRPKPVELPYIGISGSSSIEGDITAPTIESVVAFGDITGDITGDLNLESVWAQGNITGAVSSGKSLEIDAWGTLDEVNATEGVVARAYKSMNSTIDGGQGTVEATSWDAVKGAVQSSLDVNVFAYGTLSGAVESDSGDVSAVGLGVVTSPEIKAKGAVMVGGGTVVSNSLESESKDIISIALDTLVLNQINVLGGQHIGISLGNLSLGHVNTFGLFGATLLAMKDLTVNKVTTGELKVYAGGDAELRNTSIRTATIEAANVSGDITATQGYSSDSFVDIQAYGDVSANVSSHQKISIWAAGDVTGTLNTPTTTAPPSPYPIWCWVAPCPTYAAPRGDGTVGLFAKGDVIGQIDSRSGMTVDTWGEISGELTAPGGGIRASAQNGIVSNLIEADGLIEAISWTDMHSSLVSNNGYIDILVDGSLQGDATAAGDLQIEAWDEIKGEFYAGQMAVTASGNMPDESQQAVANLITHGDFRGTVTSQGDAHVDSLAQISGTIEAVGGLAAAESQLEMSDTIVSGKTFASAASGMDMSQVTVVSQGGAVAWSSGDFTRSKVNAVNDATAASKGEFRGSVTSNMGDASASTLADMANGVVNAPQGDAFAFAGGNANANVTAGSGVSMEASTAQLLVVGTISANVTGTHQASIIGLDNVNAHGTSSHGTVDVFAMGTMQGTFDGFAGVEAIALDEVTESYFTSKTGDVTLIGLADVGAYSVDAGGSAFVSAGQSFGGTVIAAVDATVVAGQNVFAEVEAGRNATVSALRGETKDVTASTGAANVFAGQRIGGDIYAHGNATAI